MSKYMLSQEKFSTPAGDLYRIIATERIFNAAGVTVVDKGDYGGFVESEHNLSQTGNCWIEKGSMVYGRARVAEDAYVCKGSVLSDEASIYGGALCSASILSDRARVHGHARIFDSKVSNFAHIYGFPTVLDSIISGNTFITNDAFIQDSSVYGASRICEDAMIQNKASVFENAIVGGRCLVNNAQVRGDSVLIGECFIGPEATIDTDQTFVSIMVDRNTYISSRNHIVTFDSIGLKREKITAFISDEQIYIFSSLNYEKVSVPLEEFIENIKTKHTDPDILLEYSILLEQLIPVRLSALRNKPKVLSIEQAIQYANQLPEDVLPF